MGERDAGAAEDRGEPGEHMDVGGAGAEAGNEAGSQDHGGPGVGAGGERREQSPDEAGYARGDAAWDAAAVVGLRRYLGDSQAQLADRLGTRQQTISEWETGSSRPRRMSQRLLRLVAEDTGYYAAPQTPHDEARAGDASAAGTADGAPAGGGAR